jgi:acetate---CoA ligase (ADP-forming)
MTNDSLFDRGFAPRAVAVYGASNRRLGSQGARITRVMLERGYSGRVALVNPRAQELFGIATVPSASDSPLLGRFDFALICVPSEAVRAAVEDCVRAEIPLAMITSSRFAELGEAGGRLQDDVVRTARKGGLRLLGPNCMGMISVTDGFYSSQPKYLDVTPGGISIIGQSGSVAVSLLEGVSRAGLGIDIWATIGNCADLGPADLLDYVSRRESTELVLCYLESLKDIPRLRLALLELAAVGKKVVLLRGGTTERGRGAAAAHTAAVASAEAWVDVLARDTGLVRARTIRQAVQITSLLATLPAFDGDVAIIGSSGGQCVLAADQCLANGVPVATLSQSTVSQLKSLVPEITADNPVDMTPFAAEADVEDKILSSVADDLGVGCVVVLDRGKWDAGIGDESADAWRAANRLMLTNATRSAAVVQDAPMTLADRRALVRGGVAVTEDGETIWAALGAIYAARGEDPDSAAPSTHDGLDAGSEVVALSDERSTALLRAAGVSLLEPTPADSAAEALGIANDLGYPVVLKALVDDIGHKTDRGLVRLHIDGADQLVRHYRELSEFVGAHRAGRVVVQRQIVDGLVELIVGAVVDPEFGPHVMVSRGGLWTEVETDRVWERAPVDVTRAKRMLLRLRVGRALFGGRRGVVGDLEATAALVSRLSEFVHEHRETVAEVDVNPVIVGRTYAVGVDCLVRVARDVGTELEGGR